MISVREHWYLLFVTAVVLINNFQAGIFIGWTSPILSIIESPNSTIPTTTDQGSWMATSVPLVSMFCTPLAAMSVQLIGRKISLALTIIPFLISWIMIALANTATELVYARAISGLGMAFSYTVTPIYFGEIAPDNMRSGIGLSISAANNLGILWIYCIGTQMEIWLSAVVCAVPLFVFLAFYKFLPESPYYLIKKKKTGEAKGVLKKLRGGFSDEEYYKIEKSIVEITFKDSMKELCMKSKHRRAIFISVGTFFVSQFTGGITFLFYAHLIFARAGNVSPNILSIIKAALQLVSSILSTYIVESTGKRPLLIISCIGSSFFMGVEGVYFYLHDNGFNVDAIWWLPLVGMILFNIFQVIGLQSIPIAFLGELFDPSIKAIGVCISKTSLALFVFIVGQAFQLLVDNFGNAVPFFVFCAMGILGLLFTLLCVPETRGKSLEDIQYYLEHKTYDKKYESSAKL